MSATPAFRRGAEEAATQAGQFSKTTYFGIEDGKSEILRFLTDHDEWITVDQHQSIPTKGKPDGHEGNWPERMSAVCRKDKAFAGMYDDCYICEFIVDGTKIKKPGRRTWALACRREEVIGDGSEELGGAEMKGKFLGYRDKTREVVKVGDDGKPEGDPVVEKDIVVVNMGYKNFFSILKGYVGAYKTNCDRDFKVTRSGSGPNDTTYAIIPLDPIEIDGQRLGKDHPSWSTRYAPNETLEDIVAARAEDDFYARFFDKRVTVTKEGTKPSGEAPDTPKPSNDVDAEKMAALANRVKDYAAGGAPEAPVAASAGATKDFG